MARFFSYPRILKQIFFSRPLGKILFVIVLFCVLTAPAWLALRRYHQELKIASRFFSNNIKTTSVLRQNPAFAVRPAGKMLGAVDMDHVFSALIALAADNEVSIISMRSLEENGNMKPVKANRARKAALRLKAKEEAMVRFFKGLEELPFFVLSRELTLSSKDEEGLEAKVGLEVLDRFEFSRREVLEHLKNSRQAPQSVFSFHPVFLVLAPVKKQVLSASGAGSEAAANLVLVGMMEDGGRNRAVFEDRVTGRTLYVSDNDMIGDLTVTEVSVSGVVLSGGGQCYAFSL
ncbi:MAG: hypothetical protein WC732_02580 [Candidatus Omnitrophota bacterium]